MGLNYIQGKDYRRIAQKKNWKQALKGIGKQYNSLPGQSLALLKGKTQNKKQSFNVTDWIVFHPNLYVEPLASNVTIFGDKAFLKVIKVKWDHKP